MADNWKRLLRLFQHGNFHRLAKPTMSMLTVEECELLSESKYRSYISQVEKALKNFENTSEWADLISALAKLNKVLLSYIKYPVIPKRVTIGKRLAQCLHPALPSGVHLKALETYDIIFKCIGTKRLAQDLFIYSAGLFPLMGHAAMNVKPILLTIYQQHFVPLGKHIKPGLNGLLLGLLPGLEEGSEFYDGTNALLENFCNASDPNYFYTCLWECIHSCPGIRLSAITFLLSHYKRRQTMEDQLYMMGDNIDLMVQSVCQAVQDSSVLVQRSMLDFLMLGFPMHNGQLTKADMFTIMKAAITVILRRDMSLNRRLYAWVLGTDCTGVPVSGNAEPSRSSCTDSASVSSEVDEPYFQTYSKELLVQALKARMVESGSTHTEEARKSSVLQPFRILISLLDKPEIGPAILENVLWSVFRSLYSECKENDSAQQLNGANPLQRSDSINSGMRNSNNSKESPQRDEKAISELLKTANLLFNAFEPYFIWDFIGRMFDMACQRTVIKREGGSEHKQPVDAVSDVPSILELCELCNFLLDIISLETYLETQTKHLPELLLHLMTCLTSNSSKLTNKEITFSLKLCGKILTRTQPSMTVLGAENVDNNDVFNNNTNRDAVISAAEPAFMLSDDESRDFERTERDDAMYFSALSDFESTASPLRALKKRQHIRNKSDSDIVTGNKSCTDQSKLSNRENVLNLRASFLDSLQHSPIKSTEKMPGAPLTLMQACVQCFQNFFHIFITQKILTEHDVAKKSLDSITIPFDVTRYSDRDSVVDTASSYSQDAPLGNVGLFQSHLFQISGHQLEANFCEAFSWACKLLVEFASFPVFCTDYHKMIDKTLHQDEDLSLPPWLQDLVVCSCFVDNFKIQVGAIATMLDLINLTQSVQLETESKDKPARRKSTTEGTVSVVILPALLPKHLKYLNNNTLFYQSVAQNLWNNLKDTVPECHQKSVELFHQLHQVTPSSWVCEDVIGSALMGDDQVLRIEAFKKFTVLWHLTRDKRTSHSPGQPLRTFDRSMLVVLDSLRDETSPAKTIASTWLLHTIQRCGINRILEPLLLMLLHPDTARISIQHVNIHQPKKVKLSEPGEDNSEAKIYAISSEGGNIIYHVSPQMKHISKKSVEDLKSFALTVMNEKGSGVMTAPTRAQLELPFERVNPENLNLRINPFGSNNSLDKLIYDGYELPTQVQNFDVNGIRRLNKETCKKEGIYFDEMDTSKNAVVADEEKFEAEDLVQEILDDIIESVTRDKETNSQEMETDGPTQDERLESFSKDSSSLGDEELLNAIEKRGLEMDSPLGSETDLTRTYTGGNDGDEETGIHTLHMHILLYVQKYDYLQTLYALSTIRSMLITCPRLMVTAMATTSISASRSLQVLKLQMLLSRHRKSVFGKNFFGELPSDSLSSYRTNMYLEIIISLCLYFIRSYYPNLMMSKLSHDELLGNKEVHILSAEILTLLLSELINLMKDSGRSFVSYIEDLLVRCKLQKAILHSVLASIYNTRKKTENSAFFVHFTETIVSFNEDSLDPSANETFQIKLLNLLLVMIMLEGQMRKIKGETTEVNTPTTNWDRPKVNFQASLLRVRYNSLLPIVQQGMFLSALLSALKQTHMAHMHRHWISMVTSALPFMGKGLVSVVMSVVPQLCRNLEAVSLLYDSTIDQSKTELRTVPPDHLLTMLEGLTTICHYCLLDNTSPVSIGQPMPSLSATSTESSSAGQILTNLIHVFNPVSNSRETSPLSETAPLMPLLESRRGLLSILPRIIACMATLWKSVSDLDNRSITLQEEHPKWTIGAPKVVRQYILEYLSPIAVPHGVNLLGAVAVAWNDRRKKTPGYSKKVIPIPCEDQLLLVDLVEAVKVLPTDTLVQTVKQVLKQPPPNELGKGKKSTLEVNLLQFFYAYVQQTSVQQLVDSWPSLLSLLKDGLTLNLTPPGQFLLLEVLNEFVQRTPPMEDRKSQKDVQDIAQKLLEAVSTIAGSCLEQTTWLRRNLAVKPGPQTDISETEDGEYTEESDAEMAMTERKVLEPQLTSNIDSKFCVQSLTLLAEMTAPLLDVVYGSDEKEKIASFLTSIMYNVFPYLRNHSIHNLPSFRACSQILSSISGYPYTRKAWRKEAFDFLLDLSFFQMDLKCIGHWHTVIDNLMTHDKTTFRDLMSRVAITQSGSLNLFSSKEQEFELRAQMLKRLSFTILCSESDQYQRNMPEIQERLADSLRTPQVPSVMSQVFLCFRVLIIRMSPNHLTSLWPTIITEMVHVFLQIEQELSTDTDEFRTQLQKIAALDSSWAHIGNGLNAHNNPIWMQLYLSVCKLLDMALVLPSDAVPQFQLYKWAFIGRPCVDDDNEEEKKKYNSQPPFLSHVARIAKLLNSRLQRDAPFLPRTPGQPLLNMTHLRSLSELQPFFNTLCLGNHCKDKLHPQKSPIPKSKSAPEFDHISRNDWTANLQPRTERQLIEESVEKDFLEFPLQ